MKRCIISNERFSWVLYVDNKAISFQGHDNAEYFEQLYTGMGYTVSRTNNSSIGATRQHRTTNSAISPQSTRSESALPFVDEVAALFTKIATEAVLTAIDEEVIEGCSHGSECADNSECSSSSTGTWIDNNNWAFLMLGIVLGAMFITLFVTFNW